MTVFISHILVLALLVLFGQQAESYQITDDICHMFRDGTVLRKPGGCHEWVVCRNSTSTAGGTCQGSTPYFSLTTGSCQAAVLEPTDTYCAVPCSPLTLGYVGGSINCSNWYYCEKENLRSQGACTSGTYFDPAKRECVAANQFHCQAKFELCQVVPAGVRFPNEGDSNSYSFCQAHKLQRHKCSSEQPHFDKVTGQCHKQVAPISIDSNKKVPAPQDICISGKLVLRNTFVSDGATCRGYYYCRDLGADKGRDTAPIWMQCPVNRFFHEEIKACVPRENHKCSYDRCDGRQKGREIAQVPGCQHYVECKNGKEIGPFKCDNDMHFDANKQTCTSWVTEYGACKA